MNKDNESLGTIFAIYALPNSFMPLLSGMFFTRIGVWKGVVAIATTIAVGVSVVAIGISLNLYWLLIIGRFVDGFVGESMYVGIDVLVTSAFAGKEIGLAYGLIQAAGQAGSFSAFYASPPAIKAFGHYKIPYIIACLISVVALCCILVARFLSGPSGPGAHNQRKRRHSVGSTATSESFSDSSESNTVELEHSASVTPSPGTSPQNERRNWFVRQFHTRWARSLGLHHMLLLTIDFWLVLGAIAVYSAVFYTFLAFGNDFVMSKYSLDMESSGRLVGIVSIASAVLSPVTGYAMDKFGGRAYVASAAMCMAIAGFCLLAFTDMHVSLGISTAGLGYALLPSSLYSLIADTVPEEAFTQVYAITNAAVNLVLVVSFYSTGLATDMDIQEGEDRAGPPDYNPIFHMFVGLLVFGLVCCLVLARRLHGRQVEEQAAANVRAPASTTAVTPSQEDTITPAGSAPVRRQRNVATPSARE